MRVVEFLGVPGSGKSTLAEQLANRLPDAVLLPDAVRHAIAARGDDGLARLAARFTRSAEGRLWNAAYARSTDRFSALARFASSHPEAVAAVLETQQARGERDLHPDVTLDWLLNLMARHQLATEWGDREWLVVDEGFAQRGMALLAGGFEESDISLLPRYLDVVPRADVLVVVETPLEVCADRLDHRGWSERLTGQGREARTRFLQAASVLSARIAADLERSGTRVIWVSGTTPAPDSIGQIAATLTP